MVKDKSSVEQQVGIVLDSGTVVGEQSNVTVNLTINLLYPELKDSLKHVLEDTRIPENVLDEIFRRNIPEHFKATGYSTTSTTLFEKFDKIIDALADIPPQKDGSTPLFKFLKDMIQEVNEENTKTELAKIIRKYSSDDIKPSDQTHRDQDENKLYLLIELTPDPSNRNRKLQFYNLKIYTWRDINHITCSFTSTESIQIWEVQKILDQFIARGFNEKDKLQAIEFFLPCNLLSLEVDQWPVKEGYSFPVQLGQEHPVVVRLNRNQQMNGGKYFQIRYPSRKRWEEKWECFFNERVLCNESVFWICDTRQYNPGELCEKFSCTQTALCLIMTFIPDESPDEIGLGHAIVQAGIPIALFCRKTYQDIKDNQSVEAELKKILIEESLSALPETIYQIRTKAYKIDDIGRHLTLIWDDPERTIPKRYYDFEG